MSLIIFARARAGTSSGSGGGGGSSFLDDPYPAYTTRLVDPAIASDVSGGTTATRTWNGVSSSYQVYKTIQYACTDFLTSGGRRVGLLSTDTVSSYQLSADLYLPNSGSSASARVVIQGDPAATAAKMPVIDLNGQHSIIPNKNNDLDWATLRKFALTNTGTQSNGNGGIALNQGASAQTCDGLILEYLDIGNFGETVSGQNCGGMTFAQKPGSWWPTVTPIVRYCKFHDCYAPGSGTPWFDFQNVSGLYLGKFCALEVHNCEFLKCAMSFFQKDSSTEGSLAHPNSVNLHHNIIATSYGGIRFLGAGASAPAGIFSAVIDSNLVYDTFTAFDFEQVDGGAQSDVLTFKNNTLSADSGQVSGLLSGGLTNLTLYDNVVLGSNGSGSIHNLYVIAISGCTNSVAYSDYNRWKVTSFRAEGTTYSALSNWQAANTAIVSLPDAHSATTTESAAFNSAGTRDYSPKAAGPLVATGRFGGNIGCYDATSIAGSTLVGAGW